MRRSSGGAWLRLRWWWRRERVIVIDAQGDLTVLPAQGSVHVLAGPGGNSAVQIGSEGPLMVDTQPAMSA